MSFQLHDGASSKIFKNAKELRMDQTSAEKILWENIRNKKLNGLKFRRQHPVGNYILDFYCYEVKLGIEVDGGIHQLKENQEKDIERTFELKESGIHILRFTNEEVLENMSNVKKKILDTINKSDT